jgi:hypothetical protein
MPDIIKSSEYRDWLRDLKSQIKTGQIKAALSVNSRMIALYWDLGRQKKVVTNFNQTLPAPQSDLADELLFFEREMTGQKGGHVE